ncbi:AraC family transcriptional regulator [Sphingomonas sp. GC_Shp_3]|uniref:AraC family transcriptional regulator n=1 Tax=Sphingomonas sp. GC_Shp_3 TaxID=2937383 RepID=UPI00226AAB0F|nr:AraC family transcriptional regulator [Sphingomonas sp. GC_Shp_3]
MTDPLAQIVSLLQPDLSYAKFVEAAGRWRVRRVEDGRAFFFAALEGTVLLDVRDEAPLLIEPGDFVLIPAAYDFTSSSTHSALPTGLNSMPVEIKPNVFRLGDQTCDPDVRMLVGHCAFASPDAALLVSLLPLLIHARGEPRLTTLIQLAVEESRGERAGRNVVLARLMEVLFIEALRSCGPHCPSGILRGLGDERVAAAMRAIHEQPAAAWDVPGLAKTAAMSRSAFFERFRRSVGKAPIEYLLQWRMVLAKRLLEDGKLSVAEIARQVGYSSASTFSVAFSRHVGASPTIFARRRSYGDLTVRGSLLQHEPVSAFG